ncbi:hypothetical protein [Saccharothrix sp. NRRL B-16314]|uniref:hypothetical protein n=1 Tax=Saccharothrix sp. NRRL B-16314 TaxID=1463825 RepID=UPI000690B9E1|nr:hypothetical protein [Saccharothrix sp. NRRL B-16314]
MDNPAHDGEVPIEATVFAELESIGDERPTHEARLRIEKGEFAVDVSMPSSHASQLLEAAVTVLLVVGALAAPAMTLKAVPEDLPHWATVGLITVQLVILILLGVNTFMNKPVLNTA